MRCAIIAILLSFISFNAKSQVNPFKIRYNTDTIGFASKDVQMEAIMKYFTDNENGKIQTSLKIAGIDENVSWKAAICPHDDYTYVGYLYPALLQNVKAKTVFLIGVCHKAKLYKLENKIIFDSFEFWKMPFGPVKVSGLREAVINGMNPDYYVVHDSVQAAEHSVEAIIPFIQFYDRDVQIVSILVPYMSFERMNEISENLSEAIYKAVSANNLEWGKDFAVVISNDAVHYGDEEWGGNNYAPYGSDSTGYRLAVAHEHEIIDNCLTGNITAVKIKKFTEYTLSERNYHDYKWTWCGRYSVPFGLLTVLYLQTSFGDNLSGCLLNYATSIDHPHIPVKNLGMGTTAPAYLRHWVGYAAIGYR